MILVSGLHAAAFRLLCFAKRPTEAKKLQLLQPPAQSR